MLGWWRRRTCQRENHQTVYDVEEWTLHCSRCGSTINLYEVFALENT